MKKIAYLFPGQGSQTVGMGKDFFDTFLEAKETFQEADDLLSMHLSRLLFEGPEETLTKTCYSQLAIFVNSIALLRTLQGGLSEEILPSVAAGLSLGEYTALFAAGKIDFEEALLLVKARGEWMDQACETTEGTMAAVLGLTPKSIEETLHNIPDVWVANYNCPGQTVISGTKRGVEEGSLALKNAGAKRIIPLSVHGAFHSGLMQSAQDAMKPLLLNAPLKTSSCALVMNVPGDFVDSLDDMRQHLIHQITSSIQWEKGIHAIEKKGVDLYIEMGAGKTLSGFHKKIGAQAPIATLEKVGDLEQVIQQIEGALCSY